MYQIQDAFYAAEQLGIQFHQFSPEEFLTGINIELEHGTIHEKTNVTNDDLITTSKIDFSNLN